MKKEKYHREYMLQSVSPQVLWSFISTATGLSDWFADKVESQDKLFTFDWNKTQQQALLIASRLEVFTRFRWLDDESDEARPYFEFHISQVELTGETALEIIDFAYPDEIAENKTLWDSQIQSLKRVIGI